MRFLMERRAGRSRRHHTPVRQTAAWCLGLALLFVSAGCSTTPSTCAETAECFKGQVCVDGQCVAGGSSQADMGGAGADMARDVCLATPESRCAEDEQEQDGKQHFVIKPEGSTRYVGCDRFSDTAELIELERQFDALFCAGDTYGDTYGIELGWCKNQAFEIALTLRFDEACGSGVTVDWDALCEDTRHRCSLDLVDDRTWRASVVIGRAAAQQPTQFVNLRVVPKDAQFQVGYTLTAKVSPAADP